MEETDWDRYGTGNYEKCADCMVHSGYEATAVTETIRRPWKAAAQALRGIRTDGPMAPDIPLANQRPAEFVFSAHVEQAMARIKARKQDEIAEAESLSLRGAQRRSNLPSVSTAHAGSIGRLLRRALLAMRRPASCNHAVRHQG